eukprot:2567481-Amphidinium_carterae.1
MLLTAESEEHHDASRATAPRQCLRSAQCSTHSWHAKCCLEGVAATTWAMQCLMKFIVCIV